MKANKIRLINAEELPIKEWRKTAHLFADDIVCAVGTDYQTNVAEAENRELHRILHAIEQAPTIDPKSLRPEGRWGPAERCADIWCAAFAMGAMCLTIGRTERNGRTAPTAGPGWRKQND